MVGGKAKRVIQNPIIYKIKDPAFGEFEIKNSANAWWLEKGKVMALLDGCKIDATIEECCYKAGITKFQYDYFVETHPKFSDIKAILNNYPNLKARQTINDNLDKPEEAKWYLERKRKNEFSTRKELTGGDGVSLFEGVFEDEDKLVKEDDETDRGTGK